MTPLQEDLFEPATRIFSAKSLIRYSRFVGGMKLALPLLAVGLVVAMMAWPSSVPPPAPPRKATAGDSTLQAPGYTSQDEKGRPYHLEADRAKKNPDTPDLTDLANPRGAITLDGGGKVEGQATGAQYDQKDGKMLINGNLTLKHTNGSVFSTERAVVDLNTHDASGDAPVRLTGDFGEVNAQGFQYLEDGKLVIFTGRSTAHLKLGASQSPSDAMQGLVPASQTTPTGP